METILNAVIFTGKKEFSVEFIEEKELLKIKTTENPTKNKANKEIIKKLKKFFKSDVEIISGLKNKEKKIKINLTINQIKKILQKNNTN